MAEAWPGGEAGKVVDRGDPLRLQLEVSTSKESKREINKTNDPSHGGGEQL